MPGHHATKHESCSLAGALRAEFLSCCCWKPLALPSSPSPFGYSALSSVASAATPWLCSCFPAGMLSPQTLSRLAPFLSPVETALPRFAVLAFTATAHHSLLFSLDSWFPGCWLQAVLSFSQHPLSKGRPPGPDALCYQKSTASALSLQITQGPELT